MSSTKLIVLKSREIIYTLLFLALVIILIIVLKIMFKAPGESKAEETLYIPGTYSSKLNLGENTLDVMVTVDENYITDVSFKQVNESVTAMYPLLESSMEEINTNLQYVTSIDDLTYSGVNQYTSKLIVNAIKEALHKAEK